jgi:hypothetical protein
LRIALFDDLFALPMAERFRALKAALVVSATVSWLLVDAVLVVYLDFLLMAVLLFSGCLPCRLVDGCTPL